MIRVSYQPAQGERVEVEIPEGREIAVLARAMERVFPGPHDPKAEAASQARWQAIMEKRKP